MCWPKATVDLIVLSMIMLKAQGKVGVCIAAAVKTLSLVLWYFLAPEAPLIKN